MHTSIYLYGLIALFFTHWLFDFVLQTRKQADNKYRDITALLSHVSDYNVGLVIYTMFMGSLVTSFATVVMPFAFVIVNSVSHFLIDFVTSRVNHSAWEKQRIKLFFSGIGFDQWLHVVILLVTYDHFIMS